MDEDRFRSFLDFDKSRALRKVSGLWFVQLRLSTMVKNVRNIDAGEGEGNVGHLPRGHFIEMDEKGTIP